MKDIFICHATRDKNLVVPIAAECKRQGLSCWIDRESIAWGADIAGNFARNTEFSVVLVVVSQNAIDRGWSIKEMSQALEREANSRDIVVLPLCVGEREELVRHFPQLSGKLWRRWDNDPKELSTKFKKCLVALAKTTCALIKPSLASHISRRIERQFTDFERINSSIPRLLQLSSILNLARNSCRCASSGFR